MRRRLLIITKDPEFDLRGEVVLGQCEPFTSGWTLKLIEVDGKQENMAVGTYADLRKIQEACNGIDDPPAVRKKISELRLSLMRSVTETVAVVARKHGASSESEPTPAPEAKPDTASGI